MHLNKMKNQGFTLIEILMSILIISILATVGITQFTNFSNNARDAATKANLGVLRTGIAVQNALERIKCGVSGSSFPPIAALQANDITTGSVACTTTQVATASDRLFVATAIPPNPWSFNSTTGTPSTVNLANSIGACSGTACTAAPSATNNCGGTAFTGSESGWCYNATTGAIWANSSRNDGLGSSTGTEYSF